MTWKWFVRRPPQPPSVCSFLNRMNQSVAYLIGLPHETDICSHLPVGQAANKMSRCEAESQCLSTSLLTTFPQKWIFATQSCILLEQMYGNDHQKPMWHEGFTKGQERRRMSPFITQVLMSDTGLHSTSSNHGLICPPWLSKCSTRVQNTSEHQGYSNEQKLTEKSHN